MASSLSWQLLAFAIVGSSCVSTTPSQQVLDRYKVIPWQVANPAITLKPIASQRAGDSDVNFVTLTRYDQGTLCMLAEVATAPRATVEAHADLFRLAIADSAHTLNELDPPPLVPASVTVRGTIASAMGEGTSSEVCFAAALTPQTRFVRLRIGPTPDHRTSTIVWELTDPAHPEHPPATSGQVVRDRTF